MSMNDFEIIRQLGKGSFANVLLVKRKEDNKIYALKKVFVEKLKKTEQDNSLNEVRILASINHINVIGYKEAFYDEFNKSLNIVMEYADDGDLNKKILQYRKEHKMFPENKIWNYAIQMFRGLKALHDRNIIHRDIKSANVFLTKSGDCKLGDLNVSKVMKKGLLYTQTGTHYYASPEVWKDRPYDSSSDIWSIGCVIYELCTLYPPFKGKDMNGLYRNVIRGKYEPINNKYYSRELSLLIDMLLQIDSSKRPTCDQILNHPIILRHLRCLKEDEIEDKENNQLLLQTIKFSALKDIKNQLPKKKNYDSFNNEDHFQSSDPNIPSVYFPHNFDTDFEHRGVRSMGPSGVNINVGINIQKDKPYLKNECMQNQIYERKYNINPINSESKISEDHSYLKGKINVQNNIANYRKEFISKISTNNHYLNINHFNKPINQIKKEKVAIHPSSALNKGINNNNNLNSHCPNSRIESKYSVNIPINERPTSNNQRTVDLYSDLKRMKNDIMNPNKPYNSNNKSNVKNQNNNIYDNRYNHKNKISSNKKNDAPYLYNNNTNILHKKNNINSHRPNSVKSRIRTEKEISQKQTKPSSAYPRKIRTIQPSNESNRKPINQRPFSCKPSNRNVNKKSNNLNDKNKYINNIQSNKPYNNFLKEIYDAPKPKIVSDPDRRTLLQPMKIKNTRLSKMNQFKPNNYYNDIFKRKY